MPHPLGLVQFGLLWAFGGAVLGPAAAALVGYAWSQRPPARS
jgi:hypothetical protein